MQGHAGVHMLMCICAAFAMLACGQMQGTRFLTFLPDLMAHEYAPAFPLVGENIGM